MHWRDTYTQKAQYWTRIFRCVPGVRAVFLSGSLAAGQGSESSDIDLFFIIRPGYLYIARTIINGILTVTGRLAKAENHPGKICPNHFVSTDYLAFDEENPYVAGLVANMKPLYGSELLPLFHWSNRNLLKKYGRTFLTTKPPEIPTKPAHRLIELVDKKLQTLTHKKIFQWNDDLPKNHGIVLERDQIRLHPKPRAK